MASLAHGARHRRTAASPAASPHCLTRMNDYHLFAFSAGIEYRGYAATGATSPCRWMAAPAFSLEFGPPTNAAAKVMARVIIPVLDVFNKFFLRVAFCAYPELNSHGETCMQSWVN